MGKSSSSRFGILYASFTCFITYQSSRVEAWARYTNYLFIILVRMGGWLRVIKVRKLPDRAPCTVNVRLGVLE